MAAIYFDKQEQYDTVRAALMPGEAVEAVFDTEGGADGFVGITTRRVIVADPAFRRKMKALVSIPYAQITTLAAENEPGPTTAPGGEPPGASLVLVTGSDEYTLAFRGADPARYAHNLILRHLI